MQSPASLALAVAGAAIPSALLGRYSAAVPEALGCCIGEEDEFLREATLSGFRRLERLVRDLVRSQQKGLKCEAEPEQEVEQVERADPSTDSWDFREWGPPRGWLARRRRHDRTFASGLPELSTQCRLR